MFDELVWKDGRLHLGDLVFYLKLSRPLPNDEDTRELRLAKERRVIEQYAAYWQDRSPRQQGNLLELGIYDGGSVAFWNEILRPAKHVAIDGADWGDSSAFQRYVASRGLSDCIHTHWGIDQGDTDALRRIVAAEFSDGTIDLVIDDASHYLAPTRASFETLFPLVRPGGRYVIEDWSWGCWPQMPKDAHPSGTELSPLVHRITDTIGSMTRFLSETDQGNYELSPLIASVTITADLLFVERGPVPADQVRDFTLEGYITRRP